MNNNDIQKQLAKLRRNKKFLWLGILFFVLVVLWILVSIFATTKTSVISKELRDLSQSFVPRLESKVFDEIADKRAFTKEELALFSIFVFNKNDSEGNSTPIDIIVRPNTGDQPAQKIEVEPETIFTETDATKSGNVEEPSIATASGNAVQTEPSTIEEASTSSMSVPQSVTDFLDYMAANN